MTWDMVLVTVALATVLLLIILLMLVSRIWQEEAPRRLENGSPNARTAASRAAKIDKVTGQENLLA